MKIKNYIIPTINKLILVFLALLGFSCSLDGPDPVAEYGMPSADFKAYGSIIDESTLNKLSNVEVAMQGDTVYSDENGNYEIKTVNFPQSQMFTISFKDVDGSLNGVYLPKDTVVDFSDIDFTNGDGAWYSGEKTKEINIKLTSDE